MTCFKPGSMMLHRSSKALPRSSLCSSARKVFMMSSPHKYAAPVLKSS